MRAIQALAIGIDSYRARDVLERLLAEIDKGLVKAVARVLISCPGEDYSTWLAHAFEPRGGIDAIAHQIAVALLYDVAKVDADAELDAAFGRETSVALDHAGLHLDGAAHGV